MREASESGMSDKYRLSRFSYINLKCRGGESRSVNSHMKRFVFLFFTLVCMSMTILAHPIDSYKYVHIVHQNDSPKDIEKRMSKEFSAMGFCLLNDADLANLKDEDRGLVLSAEYLCRQSAQCLFKIKLIDLDGNMVYEDEQVAAAGFLTYKNDRQSAIKKIFKQLKKLNYQFDGSTIHTDIVK